MRRFATFLFAVFVLAMFIGNAAAHESKPWKHPRHAKGVIVSIDTSASTIDFLSKETTLTFTVSTWTQIKKDGRSVSLDKLSLGDKGQIKYAKTATGELKALKIKLKTPVMHGTISEVTDEAITIAGRDTSTTFMVGTETKICRDGAPATLLDLAVGDHAKVSYNRLEGGGFLAKKIKASSESD